MLCQKQKLTSRDGRVDTEYLLDDGVKIRQTLLVVECRKSVFCEDCFHLFLGFLLDFWVDGHHEEEHLVDNGSLKKNMLAGAPHSA